VYALVQYNENCVWSGSWDKTIIVWNAQTKKPSQVLKGKHEDAISGLVVVGKEEDKRKVWSCSWDKTLSLWE